MKSNLTVNELVEKLIKQLPETFTKDAFNKYHTVKKGQKAGIYIIWSPSGKAYPGQSWNILKRWNNYTPNSCKSQPKINNSIKKYGKDAHKFEIVFEFDEGKWPQSFMDEMEMIVEHWLLSKGIELLTSMPCGERKGYIPKANKLGRKGPPIGMKRSQETIKKYRLIAQKRGNNGVGSMLKGRKVPYKPRPGQIGKKMVVPEKEILRRKEYFKINKPALGRTPWNKKYNSKREAMDAKNSARRKPIL